MSNNNDNAELYKEIHSSSPAKVIISGEYSVLHGHLAITSPVDLHTHVYALDNKDEIILKLANFGIIENFSLDTNIDDIKRKESLLPQEQIMLSILEVAKFLDIKIKTGFSMNIYSEIPIGSGLGSSAALIVALLRCLFLLWNIKVEEKDFLKIATNIEHIYHAKSSGIDIHTCYYNAPLLCSIQNNGPLKVENFKSKLDYQYIFSGKPECTTQECVSHVLKMFPEDSPIWNKIGNITNRLRVAIIEDDLYQIRGFIRENHRYLVEIGVVPAKVQKLIADIENSGKAAKISGSGAISGENAGIVLVF